MKRSKNKFKTEINRSKMEREEERERGRENGRREEREYEMNIPSNVQWINKPHPYNWKIPKPIRFYTNSSLFFLLSLFMPQMNFVSSVFFVEFSSKLNSPLSAKPHRIATIAKR